MFKRNMQLKKIILIVSLVLVTVFLYNHQSTKPRQKEENKKTRNESRSTEEPHIKIFDLSAPLEPSEVYEPIQCRTSAKLFVETTLCIHDLKRDIWVSGAIWKDGLWEKWVIENFLTFVNRFPEWLVFDIGAQVGQFSLFASKMNRSVVTVEPFHDNILRLHKAAKLANVEKKITLFKNAIGDQRNKIMRLNPVSNNVGGQSLLENKNKIFLDDPNDKYLVETVWLDDLVDHLPKKENGEDFENAILKIDIEGFEPFLFTHASKLFDIIQVNIIFMEWMQIPKQVDEYKLIEAMIQFLLEHKMTPFDKGVVLDCKKWKTWPSDIVWKRVGF